MIDHDLFDEERETEELTLAEKKAKKEELRRAQDVDDMEKLLSTGFGKRVLWRILSSAGLYNYQLADHATMAFNNGRKSLGLEILNLILSIRPDAWIEMQKESRDE